MLYRAGQTRMSAEVGSCVISLRERGIWPDDEINMA